MPRLLLLIALVVSSLAGCGLFGPGVPAGTVTGVVLYNGEPAAGKRVTLQRSGVKTITDANGRYRFTGVDPGRYWVNFVSDTPTYYVAPNQTITSTPNEVATWQSLPFDLAGSGVEVPAFDVAYNGLLYPELAMSLLVDEKTPVPFHWSPHPSAERYRLDLANTETDTPFWQSDWSGDPGAIFAQKTDTGRHYWWIEFDGGARGVGTTRRRQVDF